MSLTGPDIDRLDATARHGQVLSGNALGFASMFVWACGFPAAELLLDSWPPLALVTARFAMAVGMLFALCAILDGPSGLLNIRWGRGLTIGGLTFGLAAYLLVVAQAATDAVTVAIIASTSPAAAALIEVAGGSRRLTRTFTLGLLASVVGGVIATGGSSVGQLGLGALAAVVSCFLFVIGSQYTVRDLAHMSEIGRATVTLAGGLIFTATALLISHAAGLNVLPTRVVDGAQLGLLAIYAVAGTALSQVMWIASVGRLGVAVASFHINVAPFHVMLIMLALGSGWDWIKALGAGIVVSGVIIAQSPQASKAG